jgi:hypothetical protein
MTLLIQDLEYSTELDRSARQSVLGGFGKLFSYDQLITDINHGNLNGNINLKSTGNVFSPVVVTSLNMYLPVTTVVQLDLDNIVNTEQIIASSFSGGTA